MADTGKTDGPFDRIRAVEIQREKKKEEELKNAEASKAPAVLLFFIQLFKNFIEFFEKENGEYFAKIKKPLAGLKEIFAILKKEDRSEDPKFFQKFSLCWKHLLEESLQISKGTSAGEELSLLIRQIENFVGEEGEESLGYYLAKQSSQEWLPFPYMKLIQFLHEEHIKLSKNSTLARWSAQIERVIALFNG